MKDDLEAAINLAEEIVKTLPKPPGLDDNYSARPDDLDDLASAFGETVDLPALRALHKFLRDNDPIGAYSGLSKVVTPDGNILWLCEQHRKPYASPPLQLSSTAP